VIQLYSIDWLVMREGEYVIVSSRGLSTPTFWRGYNLGKQRRLIQLKITIYYTCRIIPNQTELFLDLQSTYASMY